MTVAEANAVNDRAIEAKQALLARLDVLSIGASEADSFNIVRQRDAVTADLHIQQILQVRLTAASVVVTPLTEEERVHLDQRARLLNDAIISNSIAEADLTFVTQLTAAARGIGNLLDKHTSPS